MRYLLRRLLNSLLLLVAVSILAFLLSSLAPGDYFTQMRLDPQISAQTVASLRAQYGLDQPLYVRYIRWLDSALKGNFGYSFAYNRSAGALLWPRARNTLLLTVLATSLAWLFALPLGFALALRPHRATSRAIETGIAGTLAVPEVILALGFLWLAAGTRWFPVGGMTSLGYDHMGWAGKLRDLGAHLFLPVLVMILISLPVLVRHVRSAVSEAMESSFVRFARGHGIPERRILYRYVLRSAAHPLITLFGYSIGTLLSASLLVEVVMGWPGLGPLFLEAIMARDLYVVVDAVMLSTVFLVLGNLLADVLLFAADPRIRVS